MVYTRKYVRRGRKGKTYQKKNTNFVSKVKSIVRNQVLERKRITQGTAAVITNTGTIKYSLHNIAQGDDEDERIGNVITATGFSYKGTLYNNGSATNGTMVRIILFQDYQQVSDIEPDYDDVFQSNTIDSELNLTNKGRFKILWSSLFTINMGFSGQVVKRYIQKWIKFKRPIKIRYNGTAGTDIQKNGLYLTMISDQATNTPTLDDRFTMYYVDN